MEEIKEEIVNEYDINTILKLKKSCTYNSVILHIQASTFKKMKSYDNIINDIDSFIARAKEMNKTRYNKDKFIVYADLSKTYVRNMDVSFFKQCIPLFETKYPESVEKVVIVNMPIFFKTCYALIKYLINKDTRKKIYFEKKNSKLFTNNLDEVDL